MSEKEEKVIDAEVVDGEAETKPKENGFKKFFNKTKQSVNDAVLESKIKSQFKNEHQEFSLYTKGSILCENLYGYFEDSAIVVFGKQEVDEYSVVIDDKTSKAYYTKEVSEAKVKVTVDATEYERDATRIVLDENVEEVNVIKADKKYYIYKGK